MKRTLIILCICSLTTAFAKEQDEAPTVWANNILSPTKRTTKEALQNASLHPMTIYPIGLALVFSISNWDKSTSKWASKHNPIYRERSKASKRSDELRDFLALETFITTILTYSGTNSSDWMLSKLQGITVQLLALTVTQRSTSTLKRKTDRTRPNGHDKRSFPSGHSSDAASYAAMTSSNLEYIPLNKNLRTSLQISQYVLASAVAWARVEGKHHYVTDIFAGLALGNFLTHFIYQTFIPDPQNTTFSVSALPIREAPTGALHLTYRF